jgi:hypothetical protein
MKLQRTFSCITGVIFAVGFVASQAVAGTMPPECDFVIEINALRGGSPTVTVNTSKDITAKARISKGTAVSGTVIDTTLTIEMDDGGVLFGKVVSPKSPNIRLGVGKGGQGDKVRMLVTQCNSGSIDFIATFFGPDEDGDLCTATRTLNKTCK